MIELAKLWQEVESDKAGTSTLHPTNKSSPNVISGPCPAAHVPIAVVPIMENDDVGCKMACLTRNQSNTS
jgi:hypothetical protein